MPEIPENAEEIPDSTVRLARALVFDADRRGIKESEWVQSVARIPLPEDDETPSPTTR